MRNWLSVDITTNRQANAAIALFDEQAPKTGAFDSETDGLHIIKNKPFMFQFGWLHPTDLTKGYTFLVDMQEQPELARQVIKAWHKRAARLKDYLAHNVKFDLHMLTNVGLPYNVENLSDTMYYIRAAHDALTPANGGPPLKLKEYAARYISRSAKDHDKLLQEERSAIAKTLNNKLKERLAKCGAPPKEYGYKSYTVACIEAIFNDPLADASSLPDEATRAAYEDWLMLDVPLEIHHMVTGLVDRDIIPYTWLNRANVRKYAHLDIVWVLEIFEKTSPIVETRGTWEIVHTENKLILPLYEMERVGFEADVAYLYEAKANLKQYIKERRESLYVTAGCRFSIAQHQKVLAILNGLGANITSTGDEVISLKRSELIHTCPKNPAIKIIEQVQELRTLEKWYSTYVLRFIQDLNGLTRLYTTINSVGTVSGRVTSNFQQFPKKPIKTVDGVELFHPRKVVKVSGGEYRSIVYLDYSQIELRFQALYTILVGHPDLNLCRAYMPYKCYNDAGELFDFNNKAHIKTWRENWWLAEDRSKHWQPTDVHGATTKAAFGIDETSEKYHDLRYIGKRVNFAKITLTNRINFATITSKELIKMQLICKFPGCVTVFEAKRKDTLYCPTCKKKAASVRAMRSRKRKHPEIELGVGSGKSNSNAAGPTNPSWKTGIQGYRKLVTKERCAYCASVKFLLIHHLDGDRHNNEKSNLIVLCKSCHQKYHTKRGTDGRFVKLQTNTEITK